MWTAFQARIVAARHDSERKKSKGVREHVPESAAFGPTMRSLEVYALEAIGWLPVCDVRGAVDFR